MKKLLAASVLSAAIMMTGCGHDTDDKSSSSAAKAASTGTFASTETTSETGTTSAASSLTETTSVTTTTAETTIPSTETTVQTETASENEAADLSGLAGYWYIDGDTSTASIHIYADGRFETFYASGSPENKGYIKRELEDDLNYYYYAFYSDSNEFIMSFPDDGEKDKTDIYMGNGGTPHYVKLYSEGGLGDDGRGSDEDESDNEFAGIWGCERATLKIEDKGEGVFHAVIDWSDSAYAYAEWDYPLIFDGSKLVCEGNGFLTYITYKDSSSEPERKLVYSDGKAEFEMKDNCIYWNDLKENRGEGMVFKK